MHGVLARLKSIQGKNADSNNVQVDNREVRKDFAVNGSIKNFEASDSEELNGYETPDSDLDDYVWDLNEETTENDDTLMIDLVMASNNIHTTISGNRISASSPQQMMRNTPTKGSRLSINSITSDRDDIEIVCLDNEVENKHLHSKSTEINSPMQAWTAFENTIKNIATIDSDYFSRKSRPNFNSSGTFQQVMEQMYGNTEFRNTNSPMLKPKLNNLPRISNASRRSSHVQEELENSEKEEELKSENESVQNAEVPHNKKIDSVTKVCAKGGLKTLKGQINENEIKHKTQPTQMNWALLQHTIKLMDNAEHLRQDLYERYGILPTTLDDGTVICENRMLSERARTQLYSRHKDGHEYRRPQSHQPTPMHLRSSSKTTWQKKSCYSLKNAKIANVDRGKLRPMTAKC